MWKIHLQSHGLNSICEETVATAVSMISCYKTAADGGVFPAKQWKLMHVMTCTMAININTSERPGQLYSTLNYDFRRLTLDLPGVGLPAAWLLHLQNPEGVRTFMSRCFSLCGRELRRWASTLGISILGGAAAAWAAGLSAICVAWDLITSMVVGFCALRYVCSAKPSGGKKEMPTSDLQGAAFHQNQPRWLASASVGSVQADADLSRLKEVVMLNITTR